ncbi:hypothetical protein ACOME3_003508 [Neoechinorhynchus agilis]
MGCTRSKAVSTTEALVDRYSHDLFLVAGSGDVSKLHSLIRELDKYKASVGARKELLNAGYVEADGLTALSIAAGKKHKDLTEVLAEMPEVDVNKCSTSGITALLMVAEVGWADVLGTLLQRGADVNASPTGKRAESAKIAGSTPLIGATKYNHPDCVELLLKHGARANHQNASGISALMLAAEQGYTDCVKLLVEKGNADLELAPSGEAALAMNLSGQTPLFCAAKEGHLNRRIPKV